MIFLPFRPPLPWMTPELRALLLETRRAFKSDNREELRRVQKDLKRKIRVWEANYRQKWRTNY